MTLVKSNSPALHSLETLVDEAHQHLRGNARVEFIVNSVQLPGKTLLEKMDLLQFKAMELWREGHLPVYSDEQHEFVQRDTGDYVNIALALQRKATEIMEECSPKVRASEEWKQATRTYYENSLSFANLMGTNGWNQHYPRVLNYS